MRLIILLLAFLPTFAWAQGAATLVADSITINQQGQLVASGNVEVFYEGTRLSAAQITYDSTTDRLIIQGPIYIEGADGSVLTADSAELDPQLENGILRGARLVLDQQTQLVANQIDRTDGTYSQFYRVAATSCQVCGGEAPLWEIRAQRVVHDEEAQQLYFDNAVLRIAGVPVFWLPRMRLPDPTLERATGLLVPRQRNTDQLGTGIKLPYFITLGDHRDITLTPYVSPNTTTLEAIYRQAFMRGDLRIEAAASDDILTTDKYRSYIFADGHFEFGTNYQLMFDVEAVSDPAYLLDYGYSDKDRLDSAIGILRVTDTTLSQANLTYYQTLRDSEVSASLPPLVADFSYETHLSPGIGGLMVLGISADAIQRESTTDGDAGRDVARAGVFSDWRNQWILPNGLVAASHTGFSADVYNVRDDVAYPQTDARVTPSTDVSLSWPLSRTTSSGAGHLIEPTVALAWSDSFGGTPPNEDSTRTEFDQSNLFAASRFPGEDAVETGTRAAVGMTWTRAGAAGTTSTMTFGRMFRDMALTEFSPSSGLDGTASDWLLAGQIATPGGFQFATRSLFEDSDALTRTAAITTWQNETISLGAAYIWQAADLTEARPDTVSEWTVDAGFILNDAWTIGLDGRYDVAASSPVRAGLGIEWRNECVTVDFSVDRRYTSSNTVDPTTTYSISAELSGFSAGRSGSGPAGSCTN